MTCFGGVLRMSAKWYGLYVSTGNTIEDIIVNAVHGVNTLKRPLKGPNRHENRLKTKTNSMAYPKPERLKLSRKDWLDQKHKLYLREFGLCQGCGRWINLAESHAHHIKTRGAGGGDELENLALLCWKCHRAVHDGRLKLCGKR